MINDFPGKQIFGKQRLLGLGSLSSLVLIFPISDLDCDVNCHKKCEKLTANLCGVNQKLIVEAIASVRKGKKV